jgi:hypothetical protein
MHKGIRMASLILATVLVGLAVAHAQNGTPLNPNTNNPLAVAVYGDSPYGLSPTDNTQTAKTPAFIAAINADPKVDLVLQVGDIHSGKQYCTEQYDWTIYDLWTAFKNPLIYTPGDNEWTDCHKAAEGGHVHVNGVPIDYADGDPLANLDLVRSIFYANPGYTLGGRNKQVVTQALTFDPAHPTDADYVENVMWEQSKVLFVTMNIPGGSNNDGDNWFGLPRTQAQTDEIARRTDADIRWLDAAFTQAASDDVEAVVIIEQADMWDPDGKPATHLSGYEPFISSIESHALAFAKPVLLFNGDSHHYRSDNPLESGQGCVFENGTDTGTVACSSIAASSTFTPDAWTNHPSHHALNVHRVVVHGSTEPLEWLRLTIEPGVNAPASASAFGPFSWERVMPTADLSVPPDAALLRSPAVTVSH